MELLDEFQMWIFVNLPLMNHEAEQHKNTFFYKRLFQANAFLFLKNEVAQNVKSAEIARHYY